MGKEEKEEKEVNTYNDAPPSSSSPSVSRFPQ